MQSSCMHFTFISGSRWQGALPVSTTNVEPAHNSNNLFCPKGTVRLSISLVLLKTKDLMHSVEKGVCLQWMEKNMEFQLFELSGLRKDRGPHCTSGVSPKQINNMLGEQLTAGQLTNKECTVMVIDVYARFYSCRQCWASKCRGL